MQHMNCASRIKASTAHVGEAQGEIVHFVRVQHGCGAKHDKSSVAVSAIG